MAKGHAAGPPKTPGRVKRQGLRARFKGGRGRREAFNGSLLPNVAFWNQKKRCREATFSRARSPCRWLGSADIDPSNPDIVFALGNLEIFQKSNLWLWLFGEDGSPSEVEGPGFNQPGPLLEEVKSDEEEPQIMLAEPWPRRIPPASETATYYDADLLLNVGLQLWS